ncbi:unnamed protein product [Durusdinium trenchii]|uniref:Uncharacterized protein n=1 Tax=Durusdinium trenchii TaxID=1381693 RepID=A0ABP0PBI3_9DINO
MPKVRRWAERLRRGDPELYTELLAPAPEEVPVPYERPRATEEELETVQRLKDWSDTTPQGLAKVKKLLEANATSAEVQEAGITRLGGLLAEAKGTGSALPSSCGLTPSAMCPVVMEAVCLGAGLGLLGVRFG